MRDSLRAIRISGWLGHLDEFCRADYLRFVIERIADYRISELDDLLPWNVADQISKTAELATAA